jgi:hypothetical protein
LQDVLGKSSLEADWAAPHPEEKAALLEHTRKHGLANTCRVLLNSNEFVFVD